MLNVSRKTLILLAATMWCSVGIILITRAIIWLIQFGDNCLIYILSALLVTFIFLRFIFLKMVKKNIDRIKLLPVKSSFFAFISGKSYIIILIMVSTGIALRSSQIPKHYLSVIYLGIGLALFISSFKYLSSFFKQKETVDNLR